MAEQDQMLPAIVTDHLGEASVTQLSPHIFRVNHSDRSLTPGSPRIALLTGPSGAGKDTVLDCLDPDRFVHWRTWTTRAPRPGEMVDDPHIRATLQEFEDAVRKGEFVEHVMYAGNRYGTHRREGAQALADGRIAVLRVDPVGAETYRNLWLARADPFEKADLVDIFVVPPSEAELKERLQGRDAGGAPQRLAKALDDLSHVSDAGYIAVNTTGEVKEVAREIEDLVLG